MDWPSARVTIAFFHSGDRKLVQKKTHRRGHRVHVTGRTGHGLGEHAAVEIEHARGKIAGLAHGIGERRANERLRLLVDDGDQPVPHELIMDLRER